MQYQIALADNEAKVCNTSGADNHHFCDLQTTTNIIKYMK